MQFVQSKDYVYETSSFVRFMATNDDLSTNTGAKLDLYSVSYSNQDNENGIFKLSARKKDGNYIDLIGDGNGLLTWDGKLISTGGIDLNGYVLKNSPEVSNTIIINGNNGGSAISRNNGTELHLSKWDDLDNPGGFILKCPKNKDCSDYVGLVGSSGGILMWNGKKILTEGDLTSLNKGAGGHSIGEQWISMDGTIPLGGLPFLGQTVSKTTYRELYNWAEENSRFITEEEWQSLYSKNKGNVSFYAKIDNNTFRLPSFKGYLKAHSSGGDYIKQGLPNIVGRGGAFENWPAFALIKNSGALSTTYIGDSDIGGGGRGGYYFIDLDASRSNIIYNDDVKDVTPETNTILVGVYAFNTKNDVTGEIKWFSGSTVPSGYLICNGAKVSRTTYASLFAILGTKWGAGNGSTTFNLPNLIGRVTWGANTAGGYMDAGLPNIVAQLYTSVHANEEARVSGAVRVGVGTTSDGNGGGYAVTGREVTIDASIANPIYGASTTVQPPAVTLIPIIKY